MPGSNPAQYLGYIKYTGENGKGTVELTNRKATLQPKNLRIGNTSKKLDSSQAGAHGEGLKRALLILVGRHNLKIRCRSGDFDWHFTYSKDGDLTANLRRLKQLTIENAIAVAKKLDGGMPQCAPRPGEDIQLVIGEEARGGNNKKAAVKQSEFEEWTKIALFLHPEPYDDFKVVTSAGDLILKEELCGHIYLKGLNLGTLKHSGSSTQQKLKYCYNLAYGTTQRDRQGVMAL